MRGGIDGGIGERSFELARNDIDLANAVDLITEKLYTQCAVVHVCRNDLHGVAINPEGVALECEVVTRITVGNQFANKNVATDGHSGTDGKDESLIFARITERVDTGDRCHDNDVTALEKCAGCAVAQAVDLIVDKGVFFDIHILARNVSLGLVVVVVRNKIFDGGIGKEFTHLGADLRRQGFVRLQNQCRTIGARNDVCHGKGLTRSGNTQKRLHTLAAQNALGQALYRLRLVACGGIFTFEHEGFCVHTSS